MKLKNLFQLMGFKGKTKRYFYEVLEYDIDNIGVARYAQWKHPRESIKKMSINLVNGYKQYISHGDFCIDIGAHSGDTTLPMALATGKSGCVLALEPNPFVYPVLEKVARSNRSLCNISTLMAAAGLEETFIEFEYSDSGFCNGGRHENISSLTHGHAYKLTVFAINLEKELMSDFSDLLPKLSFIKIDTEGYDLYVIRSIEQLICEYRPVIKAEVFKNTDLKYRSQMLELFEELDYTAYKIKEEPLKKGDKWLSDNLDVRTHYDILALPNKPLQRTVNRC